VKDPWTQPSIHIGSFYLVSMNLNDNRKYSIFLWFIFIVYLLCENEHIYKHDVTLFSFFLSYCPSSLVTLLPYCYIWSTSYCSLNCVFVQEEKATDFFLRNPFINFRKVVFFLLKKGCNIYHLFTKMMINEQTFLSNPPSIS